MFFLSDGESLTVACNSSFTSKHRDTHEKLDPEERAGKVMHFLILAKQHLVFRKGNFIKAILLES